jgi:release factor glutamine methyltransferase
MLKESLSNGASLLKKAGISNPLFEARILLQHALGISVEEFITYQKPIEKNIQKAFEKLIAKRKQHQPIGYIINTSRFYNLQFYTTPQVLLPRSDSEVLIEAIINHYPKNQTLKILDLGTGSGCLILTLLKHFTQALGIAVDISKKALKVAGKNAILHQLQDRVELIHSDWFKNVDSGQVFDLIASNPPYIGKDETQYLSPETFFEPPLALFAKKNGLACYEKIAKTAARHLSQNGSIYLEIGFRQKEAVENIFVANKFCLIEAYKDLNNYHRCLLFKKI